MLVFAGLSAQRGRPSDIPHNQLTLPIVLWVRRMFHVQNGREKHSKLHQLFHLISNMHASHPHRSRPGHDSGLFRSSSVPSQRRLKIIVYVNATMVSPHCCYNTASHVPFSNKLMCFSIFNFQQVRYRTFARKTWKKASTSMKPWPGRC
jgi:hypothetical protein